MAMMEFTSEHSIKVCLFSGEEIAIYAYPRKSIRLLRTEVAATKQRDARRLRFLKDDVVLNDSDDVFPPGPVQCIVKPNMPRAPSQFYASARYEVRDMIGRGTYSSVYEAFDLSRGEPVAIKRSKNLFDDLVDCRRIMRELQILQKVKHDCVVEMRDAYRPPQSSDMYEAGVELIELYIVMELCDTDLKKLLRTDVTLTVEHIALVTYNLLRGLKYLHSAGVYHRDLKPANCLVNRDCSVKITDFNLSRAVQEAPVLRRTLTTHVVTRWYRAPEVIPLQQAYTGAIDMWSAGCIFGELLHMLPGGPPCEDRGPLFPGLSCYPLSPARSGGLARNRDHDQMRLIADTIGPPAEAYIQQLGEEATAYLGRYAACEATGLTTRFPYVDHVALDLLSRILVFDPSERMQVDDALAHGFFGDCRNEASETVAPFRLDLDEEPLGEGADEEYLERRFVELIDQIQGRPVAGVAGGA
eukprot:TRINITY_DN15449_c0_g1_i1.p1 TRINITY_DN15449_c0_g1~~TRINITY_DN15449_c0_g1_i1.p1  ORF type:complete len:470 (-),score=69.00 TRINITY_DN15449_c0_g1_i1:255-1664(-)